MKQRKKFLQIVLITLATVICAGVISVRFVSAQTDDENRWDNAPALVNPALGNPLERNFNKTDTLTNDNKPRISAGQSQFRDGNLRDKTVKSQSVNSVNNGNSSIVQTSAANDTNSLNVTDATNIWANADNETDNGNTFAWQGNISPPENATTNSNIIATPYASPQQTFSGNNNANTLAMQNALLQQQAFIQQQQALQQQAMQQNGMNSLAAYPLPAAAPLDPNYAYPQAPYPNLFTPPVMPPYANQYPPQYASQYPSSYTYNPHGQPQMPMGSPYDYMQQQQYLTAMRQEELRQNEMNGVSRENRTGLPPRQSSSPSDNIDDTNKSWSVNDLLPLKVSSPLAETLWTGAGYLSPFAGADTPDRGVGQPLKMRSWTDRPYYIGAFIGYVGGSELMNGSVTTGGGTPTTVSVKIKQNGGGMGGLTLGWNFHNYWGMEGRLHFSSYNLKFDYSDPTLLANIPTGSNQLTTLDVSVHYYPLGNSRWRPFFKYGLGLTGMSFTDFNGAKKTVSTMSMPVGIGIKYWWNEKITVHADLIDNVVFGADGVKSQNNWGLTFGMTYALGSNRNLRPTNYWPYTPSGSR